MTAKSFKVQPPGLCCVFPAFQIHEKMFSYFSKNSRFLFNCAWCNNIFTSV